MQRAKLAQLFRKARETEWGARSIRLDWDYPTFAERFPVTDYTYWESSILLQKESGRPLLCAPCDRYEPTSGSLSRRKWIPYSPAFTQELGQAASAWLHDLGKSVPRFGSGKHYWSMSWLPTELRGKIQSTNDMRLFASWKQLLLSQVMAVPEQVISLSSSESSQRATIAYLAATSDLTVFSVWSPTFAIELLHELRARREELSRTLETGRWELPLRCPRSPRAASLLREWDGKLEPEFLRALWPEMKLVSAWDSSTSAGFARELKALFPRARFQGKGLWATEGVVTIPFQDRYPLAVTSHFYEFRCLETSRVSPAWGLEKGQVVQPILSTASGLFRYALPDRIEVTGFLAKTPTFRFLGRMGGIDLVGEKLDRRAVEEILHRISEARGVRCLSLIGCQRGADSRPRYLLLASGKGSAEKLAETAENRLLEFHHYRVARELSQLGPVKAILSEDALGYYRRIGQEMIAGSRKLEPLLCIEKEPE